MTEKSKAVMPDLIRHPFAGRDVLAMSRDACPAWKKFADVILRSVSDEESLGNQILSLHSGWQTFFSVFGKHRAIVISRSIATRNLKCSMKVMKKSVDRRGETDYKFLPLSSSKSGFEHGIKRTWGEHHAERIRILSNWFSIGFFVLLARSHIPPAEPEAWIYEPLKAD